MSAPSLAHVVFSRLHLKVSATFLGFLLDSSVSWSFRVSILKQKWEENERMRVSKHSNILLVLMVESQCQCFPVESHNSKRMRFQGELLRSFSVGIYHEFNVSIWFKRGVGKRNSGPLECSFPTDWPRDSQHFVWPEERREERQQFKSFLSVNLPSESHLQHFSMRGVRRTRSSNNPKRLTKTIISMK